MSKPKKFRTYGTTTVYEGKKQFLDIKHDGVEGDTISTIDNNLSVLCVLPIGMLRRNFLEIYEGGSPDGSYCIRFDITRRPKNSK